MEASDEPCYYYNLNQVEIKEEIDLSDEEANRILVKQEEVDPSENLTEPEPVEGKHKGFKCLYCRKEYRLQSYLLIHQRKHTGEDLLFKCKDCRKSFPTQYALEKHEQKHIAEKRLQCRTCKKSFSCTSQLLDHVNIHKSNWPYKCNENGCDRVFSAHLHLMNHLKDHEKNVTLEDVVPSTSDANLEKPMFNPDKPYMCKECSMCFRKNSDLEVHLKVHYGRVQHECRDCFKLFPYKSYLDRHAKEVHGVLKQYECKDCYKRFSKESTLEKHENNIHVKRRFKCGECQKSYAKIYALKKHMIKHLSKDKLSADSKVFLIPKNGGAEKILLK